MLVNGGVLEVAFWFGGVLTGFRHSNHQLQHTLDRVSVPSPIAVDILMVHNGEGHNSHVPVFCVNFERHICTRGVTEINSHTALLPIIAGYQLSPPGNETFIFQ